jgi:hypothetical protein
MCDLLVCNRYVCDDCAEEFSILHNDFKGPQIKLSDIFDQFMDTEKVLYGSNRITTVQEFLYGKDLQRRFRSSR